jgi:phosphoserine phosphatase
MNGELDFEGALLERVALLNGLPETTIARVRQPDHADARRRDTRGDDERAWRLHGASSPAGSVSFSSEIAGRLGFDEDRANTLLAEDGVLTGNVARPILGRDAKVRGAGRDRVTSRDRAARDVLAIGDGANDLGMIERAGTGVAVHAKPSVQAAAPHRINHGDLTAILFLQGYSRDEFVTP